MSVWASLVLDLLVWPFLSMWRSYVVIVLWGWFVSPVIGVVAPTIYVMTGIMMTLHAILPIPRVPKNEDGPLAKLLNNILLYGLLAPATMLGLGWVWKWLQWGIV